MNTTNNNNGIRPALLVTMTVLGFLAGALSGALSSALVFRGRQMENTRRILETIPLRNDQRKQTIRRVGREMSEVRFYDDSTILYVSGESLFLQCLWDEDPVREFRGHTGPIQDYELSPDRRRIATSSQDGTLRLWDTLTGQCLAVSKQVDTLSQPSWTMLHDIVYHPDGSRILSADMEGVKVWRTNDLKLLETGETDIFYMCNGLLSPDWETLCAPIFPDGLGIYGRRTGELLDHIGGRAPVCYSGDGRRLVVADWDAGSMEIVNIDPRTMREQRSLVWINSPSLPLCAAAFSSDGECLVSAHEDGTIRLWNAANGASRELLHWEGRHIDGVCFSPSGSKILAYSRRTGEYSLWGPFQWMI